MNLGKSQSKRFQSAFHRGNGCYFEYPSRRNDGSYSFSPLFIAAMVATLNILAVVMTAHILSVRFSSRQWLLLGMCKGELLYFNDFQSAFHRGNGCYISTLRLLGDRWTPFSPLFIAAMVATRDVQRRVVILQRLSVRFSSRQWLLHIHPSFAWRSLDAFQSAFHRGNGCYP